MLMGNGIMAWHRVLQLPEHFSRALFVCTFPFIIYGLLMSLFKTNKHTVFYCFEEFNSFFSLLLMLLPMKMNPFMRQNQTATTKTSIL
jgi:hypothetical protein